MRWYLSLRRAHPLPASRPPMSFTRRTAALLVCTLAGACRPSGESSQRPGTPASSTAQAGGEVAVSPASGDTILTKADEGRITGNPAAKVWLIIVSDFECPFCRMWHDSTYAQVKREYVDNGK